MIKTTVLGFLVLGISVSSLQAQITARRLTSRITPAPTQAPAAPAPAAPAAPAQPVAPPRPPVVSPLITALDTNHNGVIEAGEIANAPEALKTLDKNKDGQLTADEYLGVGESPTSPVIKSLDVDGDGVIDEKEIAGAALSLRMLDKNMDGKLSLSEFRPVPEPAPEPAPKVAAGAK